MALETFLQLAVLLYRSRNAWICSWVFGQRCQLLMCWDLLTWSSSSWRNWKSHKNPRHFNPSTFTAESWNFVVKSGNGMYLQKASQYKMCPSISESTPLKILKKGEFQEICLSVYKFKSASFQGTIGCTPNSVPMVGVHPTIPWSFWNQRDLSIPKLHIAAYRSSSSTSSAEMLYASHRSKPGSFLTKGLYIYIGPITLTKGRSIRFKVDLFY